MNWKNSLKSMGVILALVLTVTMPVCYIAAAAGPEAASTEISVAASSKLDFDIGGSPRFGV